jgi:hypothetical protein
MVPDDRHQVEAVQSVFGAPIRRVAPIETLTRDSTIIVQAMVSPNTNGEIPTSTPQTMARSSDQRHFLRLA